MIAIPNIFLNMIIRSDRKIAVLEENIKLAQNQTAREDSITEYIDFLCEKLDKAFGKTGNKKLPKPKIIFSDKDGIYNCYFPEKNLMVLRKDVSDPAYILHEFRHYIQAQFHERLYKKYLETPLPHPFYYTQPHEICAYNFQHFSEIRNFGDIKFDMLDRIFVTEEAIKFGLLNKKVIDTERIYYKDCNILDNLCNLPKEVLDILYGEYKEKDFELEFNNDNFKIKHFELDTAKYFNVTFNTDIKWDNEVMPVITSSEYVLQFGIKNDTCTIYGIHPIFSSPSSHKEYEQACKIASDFAFNFAKAYNIKEINTNPYSLHINKHKFKNILKSIKQDYSFTQRDTSFNKISNPFPKENIIADIIKELNIPVPQNFVPDIIKEQDELLKMHIEYTISKNKGIEKDDY